MLSRRRFLQTSSVISLSPWLPCVFGNTARAAGAERDGKVIVVIQLDGGNDGINTVVPFADDGYGRARDKLRLPTKELHKLNEQVGLHRSMEGAKELFDDGHLAIVQGVGYPNPNRSHFRSMKIWQTARFDEDAHDAYGWLGRALDLEQSPSKADAAAQAMFISDRETPVALWGRRSRATALSRAEDLRLHEGLGSSLSSFAANPNGDSVEQFVSRQIASAYAAAEDFERQQATGVGGNGDYPDTKLGSRLELVSQLIKSGSRARVYYTVQGGYDTHSVQLYTHSRLLRDYSRAMKAFLDDLKAAGLLDRVVVLAFSEFGRRVKENDSQGTDHGTAAPVFIAGGRVSGGLIGQTPNLTDLDQGDVKMQIDFRRVYATLLDEWLDVDAEKVLGTPFENLPLLTT